MSTLLFIIDDVGKDYCEPYFKSDWLVEPRQPNLMALASIGVLFDEFYATPSCSQSRVAIETGRLGYRTGVSLVVQPNGDAGDLDVRETKFRIAHMLKRHARASGGYRCGFFGKEHVADDAQYGFRDPIFAGYDKAVIQRGNIGVPAGNGTSHTDWVRYNMPPDTVPSDALETTTGYSTFTASATTADAAAWINDAAQAGKQWFCVVSFSTAHAPYDLPPNGDNTYDTTPEFGITGTPPEDDTFLAILEATDTYIGRMLTSIAAGGNFHWDRDTVIFLGDNGSPEVWVADPFDTDHAKQTTYRHGTCVPLIVAGGGVVGGGRRTSALVAITDIYSTILDLAGIDQFEARPEGFPVDGVSFRAVLESETDLGLRKWAYRERYNDNEGPDVSYQRSITDGRCDLIIDAGGGSGLPEFYDNTVDPYQASDLLASGAPTRTMSELQAQSYGLLSVKLAEIEAAHGLERAAAAVDPTTW